MRNMRNITEHVVLDEGQTILIAYHLHKRCFSIRHAKTRKVIGYKDRIVVQHVQFIVSESGRQRVLRERRKNVHAYVRGVFENKLQNIRFNDYNFRGAYYNPYSAATFVDVETKEPIAYAELAICENGKVFFIEK